MSAEDEQTHRGEEDPMEEGDLPKPEEIEVETHDIYRHDDNQAFVTLMSVQVKPLNFACEENYTVRLCKEIVAHHYPDEMPLGSFELLASNKIRSDEETLGEVFNGEAYYTDKKAALDPEFDWKPRKEQVFSDHQLMQLSIWKKDWDEDKQCYEPIDLSYSPYGRDQTKLWKKLGYLDENNRLLPEQQLIEEGKITDPEHIDRFKKRQALIQHLREEHCFREVHAKEVSTEVDDPTDVQAALKWLKTNKEKHFKFARDLVQRRTNGEEIEVEEDSEDEDDPEIERYVCDPPPLRG